MATSTLQVSSGQINDDDLQELRDGARTILGAGIATFLLGCFGLAAVDPRIGQPSMILVILPLAGAAGACLSRQISAGAAGYLTIAGLGLAIASAVSVYQDARPLFCFPLLIIVASALSGDRALFLVAGCASAAAIALANTPGDAGPPGDLILALFLIWATVFLSRLATRPTRSALDWSWRSYLLSLERTKQLQERQGELGRLAKSLNETCVRLEQMNGELDRSRRAAEEARRLKADFAMAISHELRTPLNLIIGFSEMMLKAPADGRRPALARTVSSSYREGVEAIHRNAYHISRLVDDILDLGQIDAHRLALERDWVNLDLVIDQAASAVAGLFHHLNLDLQVEVAPDLPRLYADADRVRQVLINLLNNAVRFTDRGRVTIGATRDERHVLVTVTDTGVGIAPEDIPHVFREFHQAGPSGRRQGGNGLGLAISKRFVEMHGGSIWVASQLGAGTTFSFTLPVCGNVLSAPLELPSATRAPVGLTVAVLDRDLRTARVFQRYLDGYQVAHVKSARELSQLAASRPVHGLLVNELSAPDGWREAQRADPRLAALPVFTYSLEAARQLAEESGAAECLFKPVSRRDLVRIVRRHGRGAREILVVEDDPEMAKFLATTTAGALRRGRIQSVADGLSALSLLRAQPFDLILLDLGIPRLSGLEVLEHLRADASYREVPVIIITGEVGTTTALRTDACTLARADGLTIGELMRCLRASLDVLVGQQHPDNAPMQLTGRPG